MFDAVNKNHHIDIIGIIDIIPLVKNSLRVLVISYLKLAIINIDDDLRPCAIIITKDPVKPHEVLDNIPASIKPIWPTDEYAIKDFRSGCRMQIKLVTDAPVIATLVSIEVLMWHEWGKMVNIRASPYPPNFRRIAASTIDPAIGASTWALGNHRWTENIGSFTKNPAIIINHESL